MSDYMPDEAAWGSLCRMAEEIGIDVAILDAGTIGLLRRTWMRDRDMFKLQARQSLVSAAAHARSQAHWDRRAMDQFVDLAVRNGTMTPGDIREFTIIDDLAPEVQKRLIDIRRTMGIPAYASALGEARDAAARKAANEAQQS